MATNNETNDPPGISSKSDTATTISSQDALLLNAPAEVRNIIYREVLVADRPIDVFSMSQALANTGKRAQLKFCLPGLLHTCRQISQEARSIYYAENTFAFQHSVGWISEVVAWLKSLHPEDLEQVRHIHLKEWRIFFADRAAQKLAELERRLNIAGVEIPNCELTMFVESRVVNRKAPCCERGHCGYTRHYVNPALLSDLRDVEAPFEDQSEGAFEEGDSEEDSEEEGE